MELSKYISDTSERFYHDYRMLYQKVVDFLKENSNLDLEHIAKSTDPVDIYERLKVLLLKNTKSIYKGQWKKYFKRSSKSKR